MDIYILIPQNEKIDELMKLKYSNDEKEIEKSQDLLAASAKNATFETRKGANTTRSQFHYLELSKIQDLLTGVGRIIEYKSPQKFNGPVAIVDHMEKFLKPEDC